MLTLWVNRDDPTAKIVIFSGTLPFDGLGLSPFR